jgi:hypothetical protein
VVFVTVAINDEVLPERRDLVLELADTLRYEMITWTDFTTLVRSPGTAPLREAIASIFKKTFTLQLSINTVYMVTCLQQLLLPEALSGIHTIAPFTLSNYRRRDRQP